MPQTTCFYQSPLGWMKIVADNDGVCGLDFIHPHDYETHHNQQSLYFNKKTADHGYLGDCIKQLQEYFSGQRQEFDLPLSISGTKFQQSVLNALRTVSYGETLSYQQIAQKSGFPKAHRAAANVIAANPISIIIPCHRVILSSGRIGGYGWGEDKKQWLLKHEGWKPF